ncbi:hypothetical protein GBAR_LOCUS29480 [Geodia barretti]|uniref:Uncharacterized protein n=1 Tax=Geodia barretti TaxID=519541 RepID=A0AA35XDY8_GEOBA|nr:hypothetical protein GBAR_LOCUS29480 [Geodia barretti]
MNTQWNGAALDLLKLNVSFKAVHLPPEGVAAYVDVHKTQRFRATVCESVGYDNHAGASAPDRHTRLRPLPQRIPKAVDVYQLDDRGAFATGDNQPVDLV